ncbi:MAG: RNA 2',3'-cyclic phosphodiesterase, partial [Candidatus Omnitrophota bacterium]|nr:RNA 2',3'-cyclic phosphodiesterase [Candidatus Omnitrophota bacterium]
SAIGGFPNLSHPRVIWIGIDKGAKELKNLAEKIESGLEKFDFRKESHEFKSHLTLGRVKSSKNMLNLVKLLKETSFSSETDISINELILFQSTLTPKGATYTTLMQLRFSSFLSL